ncbi:MAG TPA: hypothetical protein H9832_00515 [Candidatus Agathobaculum merdavium]|nr:hypothetical protein [Candidatus Agathobaculum merdavium]
MISIMLPPVTARNAAAYFDGKRALRGRAPPPAFSNMGAAAHAPLPFCFHYTGFFRFFNPLLDKWTKPWYDFAAITKKICSMRRLSPSNRFPYEEVMQDA